MMSLVSNVFIWCGASEAGASYNWLFRLQTFSLGEKSRSKGRIARIKMHKSNADLIDLMIFIGN